MDSKVLVLSVSDSINIETIEPIMEAIPGDVLNESASIWVLEPDQ